MKKIHWVGLGSFLGLVFGILASGLVRAGGLAVEECTSCTSLVQFEQYAAQNMPSGASGSGGLTLIHFVLVNPNAALLATMTYEHFYDDGTGQWVNRWFWGTNSTSEMEEAFAVAAPPFQINVPSSVATTFTGSAQAGTVSAWFDEVNAGTAVPLGTVALVVFSDGSSAEYQATSTDPTAWSFVPESGHATDGSPENDSGQVVNAPSYNYYTQDQSVTFPPIEMQLAADEKREESFTDGLYCSARCQLQGELSIDFSTTGQLFDNYFPCITGVCGNFPGGPGS